MSDWLWFDSSTANNVDAMGCVCCDCAHCCCMCTRAEAAERAIKISELVTSTVQHILIDP
eukprot:scaffold268_cov210-Ochromonas_danica.AAC.59